MIDELDLKNEIVSMIDFIKNDKKLKPEEKLIVLRMSLRDLERRIDEKGDNNVQNNWRSKA